MMVLYGLKYLPGNICKMTAKWADFTVRTKIQPTVYYNILQILSKNIISATNNAHWLITVQVDQIAQTQMVFLFIF